MAIERAIVMSCLDFAARVNKDGKASTVCEDAKTFLQWYETEALVLKAKDPIKRVVMEPLELGNQFQAAKDAAKTGAASG